MSPSVSQSSQIYNASQKRSVVLNIENVKVCYKPTSTLSQVFTKPKDHVPPQQTNGVFYKTSCSNRDLGYYGQTDKEVITRIKEHKKAASHCDQ